jgi:hypothetical protein
MFIAHLIVDDRHIKTKEFSTDQHPRLIAKELIKFQGDPSKRGELILCDDDNYPLEDTE